MNKDIKVLSDSVFKYTSSCYRHLHAHPELSFQEYETSAFIQKQLTELQIPFRANIAGTGILGRIEGRNPQKKLIALRADMDALPVHESVDVPWKSMNANVMHACGHDAHVACLLGAANILKQLCDEFEGTILLIFQPGEEKAPGGASLMLQDGLFDENKPEAIIAQHVSIDFPTGSMAFLPGTIMASADEIHLTIRGKGGHGALPHLCNDTVLAASQTVVALQQVRSRICHPLTPMVLTFGKLIADGATNIIPSEVLLSGTFRTVDEIWRKEALEHIRRIVTETCTAHGCIVEIDIPKGYPCVVNDTPLTEKVTEFAAEWAGEENIDKLELRLTSEDFGFFTQHYPCCFYRFGVKGDTNPNPGGLHSPTFCIDEKALLTGAGGLAYIARRMMD